MIFLCPLLSSILPISFFLRIFQQMPAIEEVYYLITYMLRPSAAIFIWEETASHYFSFTAQNRVMIYLFL